MYRCGRLASVLQPRFRALRTACAVGKATPPPQLNSSLILSTSAGFASNSTPGSRPEHPVFARHSTRVVGVAATPAGMASTVTERFTWEQLKDLVRRGTSGEDVEALGILGRCEADLLVYRAHRAKLLQQYVSLNDYLRIRLFGAPSTVDAESGKLAVAQPDPTTRTRKVLVMANEFPYYCQEGVHHINIWSSGEPLTDRQVESLISERLPCADHCWFVNPPQYQSVRTIWHCHVLTLGLRPEARLGRPGEAEPYPEEDGEADGQHGMAAGTEPQQP